MKRSIFSILAATGWAAVAPAQGSVNASAVPARLPSAIIVVPMSLPGRINGSMPAQLPSRPLPWPIRQNLELPAQERPSAPRQLWLPAPETVPGRTRVIPGLKTLFAGRKRAAAISHFFDNSGAKEKEVAPPVAQDEDKLGRRVKGDSSHLTLPESDLEGEIGIGAGT